MRRAFWQRGRALALLDADAQANPDAHRVERDWLEIQIYCGHGERKHALELARRRAKEHAQQCTMDPCPNPFARSLLSRESLAGAPQRRCELDALAILDSAFAVAPDPWTQRIATACGESLWGADKHRRIRKLPLPTCPEFCVDPPPPSTWRPPGMQCVEARVRAKLDAVRTDELPCAPGLVGSLATPFELDVVRALPGSTLAGPQVRVWQAGGSIAGVVETMDFVGGCMPDLFSRASSFEICLLPVGAGWVPTCKASFWDQRHAADVGWWKQFCSG